MLWVLKRTVSMGWFFWTPKTDVKMDRLENIYKFTFKYFIFIRGTKIPLFARNYEWNLERTSNSSQSTGPLIIRSEI